MSPPSPVSPSAAVRLVILAIATTLIACDAPESPARAPDGLAESPVEVQSPAVVHKVLWVAEFGTFGRAYVDPFDGTTWVRIEEGAAASGFVSGGVLTVSRSIRPGDTITKDDHTFAATGVSRSADEPEIKNTWHEFRRAP